MSTNSQPKKSLRATRKSILQLSSVEARAFLLKPESYCNLDLPSYLQFGPLIDKVDSALNGKSLSDFKTKQGPRDFDDVNHTILHNKDGKYAWRHFELIHPVLYVSLVHEITSEVNWQLICNRFQEFSSNKRIRCLSFPMASASNQKDKAEQISQWWHELEQCSIEFSLDYGYLIETDITDCYGAIYTHSIAWALHTKEEAKKYTTRHDKRLIGNLIDNHIQDMRHGQTNGIPQGSALMDFVAEMVLGFADLELSERLEAANLTHYQILRYRDDYRIFVNNSQTGETIVKLISETTAGLGLKLSPVKTKMSSDVVRASIKSDKLAWMGRKQSGKSLQKHLLIIHDHASNFSNSGSLVVALNDFHKRISRIKSTSENPVPIIAIVVDIAYRNPRTYSICAAIISKLLSFVENQDDRLGIATRILKRFSLLPNTDHMRIWLQRVTYSLDKSIEYDEAVCQLVGGNTKQLWNSDWISSTDLKATVDEKAIVNTNLLEEMAPLISPEEVALFISNSAEGYY